ncbi:MAG TPA: YtxH domain-containing protein [Candidatus Dormibacteraeota bacterium]|jgi:gas vesicle protein|nr:YtxH domain-containing protein [Candidatus Dormibacteraeota bacterium]
MGYVRGFVHGSVVGAVVGICIAPQPGDRTRQQLAAFGAAARDGYQVAERTVRRVAPFASAAAGVARHQVDKVIRDDDALSVEGSVRIHNETNGRH